MGPLTSDAGAIQVLPADMCDKYDRFVSGVSKHDFETYHAVLEDKRTGIPGASPVLRVRLQDNRIDRVHARTM
jgi:hypothetical protein